MNTVISFPTDPHVIRRHGAFFRPGAAGYTHHIAAAGIYSQREAERYLSADGVTIHPLEEYRAEIDATIAGADRLCTARRAARGETPFERSRHLRHVPALEGDLSTRRHWIIVHEPGRIPEKKGSFKYHQVADFLRELIACRPEGTRYTVVSLTWDFDIWVESGHDHLIVADVMGDEADAAGVSQAAGDALTAQLGEPLGQDATAGYAQKGVLTDG